MSGHTQAILILKTTALIIMGVFLAILPDLWMGQDGPFDAYQMWTLTWLLAAVAAILAVSIVNTIITEARK